MITLRKLGTATAVALAVTATPSISVEAATTHISGTFVVDDDGTCPGPPSGFEDFTDYDPFIISGDLEGCWYTKVDRARDLGPPSGLFLEAGREVFVGELRGQPGTFSTVYSFQSKWDPDAATGTEIWGRCQHLLVRGSGTGDLHGITGHFGRVDNVADGTGHYRGIVRLP